MTKSPVLLRFFSHQQGLFQHPAKLKLFALFGFISGRTRSGYFIRNMAKIYYCDISIWQEYFGLCMRSPQKRNSSADDTDFRRLFSFMFLSVFICVICGSFLVPNSLLDRTMPRPLRLCGENFCPCVKAVNGYWTLMRWGTVQTGTKKVTKSTKERSGSGVKNTKESSERNSTDSGFKRLKVKIRYSYSFFKEVHWLTVIPVNTGQMQGLMAQQTDLIDNLGLDSLR